MEAGELSELLTLALDVKNGLATIVEEWLEAEEPSDYETKALSHLERHFRYLGLRRRWSGGHAKRKWQPAGRRDFKPVAV